MAGPWEKFAASQEAKPWEKFKSPEAVPTPAEQIGGVLGQAATGIVKGIPNLLDVGGAAVAAGAEAALGVEPQTGFLDKFQQFAATQPVSRGVDIALGTQERQPTNTVERIANFAGQGAATAPLMLARPAMGAISGAGAAAGGDIGQAVGGDVGGLIGGIAGGLAAPMAVKPMLSLADRARALVQRSVAPKLDQSVAKLAERAQSMDIPVALSQASPSRLRSTMQKVTQAVPFSGVGAFEAKQAESWNRALSRTLGMDTPNLGPESVNKFLKNVDEAYSRALDGTTVRINKQQLSRLDEIANEASMSLGDDLAKTVRSNIDYVKSQLKDGMVRGEKANSIRKQIAARSSSGDPSVRDWLGQIASTLNDTIAESIPQQNAELLRTVNRQYRNFKTIEPLLEKAVDGQINPTLLNQRVASTPYIKASRAEVGQDDLVDLAKIGKLLTKEGGSDTYSNIAVGGGGVGLLTAPGATLPAAATAVSAARGYQKLYNQSQNILSQAIEKSLPKGVSIKSLQDINQAIPSGNPLDIINAAGGVGPALVAIDYLKSGGDRETQKEAFELKKAIRESESQ